MTADENTLLSGDENGSTTTSTMFMMESIEHISENWKSIMCVGVLNIITGTGCLMFPVFTTQVAELFLTTLVFCTGLLNMLAVCAARVPPDNSVEASASTTTRQSPLFWVGFIQILLAILMYTNPFLTLSVLTFFIAVTFMLLGSIQISMARRYRHQVAGRALMILSGVSAIAMSIIICLAMPTAQFFTIGVLMGANLINVGINRVIIAAYGRKLASAVSSDETESWRSVLDADIV